MRRLNPFLTFTACVVILDAMVITWFISQDAHHDTKATAPVSIEVYFSPHGGCTDAIVKEINAANSTILVQAYGFTSLPIANALIAATKRKVQIAVILDKKANENNTHSEGEALKAAGITVFIDPKHAISHNKIILIDDDTLITGSFNFTDNAENNNAENLVIIKNWDGIKKYTANWQKHLSHSYAEK